MNKILIGSRVCLSREEVPYNQGLKPTGTPLRSAPVP